MVFRINKTKDYTIMCNTHLRDTRLTLKAKGLLSMILSLPDDWHYSIAGLTAVCCEKESAVKTALNELKNCGYLRIDKVKPNYENGGRWEYVYNIFEKPQTVENQKSEILQSEILQAKNLPLENHPLYKELNNKELNNKELNNTYICAVPKKSATAQAETQEIPPEEIAISIPLVNGTDYHISKTEVEKMKTFYPAVDIMEELRKCAAWNYANPKNRKTSRGILKHINSWLSRAQDSARRNPYQQKQEEYSKPIDFDNLWYNGLENDHRK